MILGALVFLTTGCDDEDSITMDKNTLVIAAVMNENMGCFSQGDCSSYPSIFIFSPSLDREDCKSPDKWTLRPSRDWQCGTDISGEMTIGDTTTTTYVVPK